MILLVKKSYHITTLRMKHNDLISVVRQTDVFVVLSLFFPPAYSVWAFRAPSTSLIWSQSTLILTIWHSNLVVDQVTYFFSTYQHCNKELKRVDECWKVPKRLTKPATTLKLWLSQGMYKAFSYISNTLFCTPCLYLSLCLQCHRTASYGL